MKKCRFYFDVTADEKTLARLYEKAQDCLMDVFWEENVMPEGGIKTMKLEGNEDAAQKKS